MIDPAQMPPDSFDPFEFISTNALFGRMDRAMRAEIADALEPIILLKGERLFRQGDPGDSLYVIDRGLLEVQLPQADGPPRVLDRLEPGATVGEMSLLTGQPRTADIVAVVDSRLVKLSREGFEQLAAAHPAIFEGLAWSVTPRIQRTQLAEALYHLLGEVDAATLHSLQGKLIWRRLADGEVLMRQGEVASSMYIVINGRLQVVREEMERHDEPIGDVVSERLLDEVTAGVTIGEAALLNDGVRSATVYAIRDTDVVEMQREVFEELVHNYPQVMTEIARLILSRLQRTQRIALCGGPTALTIAIVPAGNQPVPLSTFARHLYEVLSAVGETALFTSETLDAAYGRRGASQLDADHPLTLIINGWLQQQESRFRHIIYVADPVDSRWTQRCVSQSDRILLLGRSGDDPQTSEFETRINPRTRRELVLLYPSSTQEPSETARWLAERQVTAHHHIRETVNEDWERLARRLTNRAVGVVFSGGSARGLAHLGVIQAMEQAGLAIDYIGGTSVGAMIGAGWAAGISADDGLKLAQSMANPATILDRTFPYTAIMASRKVTDVLHALYGERHIEDLWRPFFCVSTNLTTATLVVHEQGLLWRAVRASTALPGVFSPILNEQGELLADGGIMNNFPVDVMATRLDCGLLIGVNVSPHVQSEEHYSFGESISGWEVLLSRANPFASRRQVPSLAAIMLRTMEVNSLNQRNSAERLADIIIEPHVQDIGALDFSAFETLIARGYAAGRDELARWRSAPTEPK